MTLLWLFCYYFTSYDIYWKFRVFANNQLIRNVYWPLPPSWAIYDRVSVTTRGTQACWVTFLLEFPGGNVDSANRHERICLCPLKHLIRWFWHQLKVCVLYKLKGGKVTVAMPSYDKMARETCDMNKMAATCTAICVPSTHDHYSTW